MKNVYVVGEAKHYANFITGVKLVDTLEKADIVIFTGGEDVDPSLYGEEKHQETFSNIERDLYEKSIFEQIKPTQLVVGVCRGSQFLCVMNGGKLVQHCTNHGIWDTHPIYCPHTNTLYEITSTHHQMQYPYNLDKKDYTMLAISHNNSSYCYIGTGIDEMEIIRYGEPEVVLYHKENTPRCIAIQGHPEYMRKDAPVVKYLNIIINEELKKVNNYEIK